MATVSMDPVSVIKGLKGRSVIEFHVQTPAGKGEQGFVGESCEWPVASATNQKNNFCDASHPFLCPTGECAASRGKCALMQASEPPDWDPASYIP
eukprot:68801-Hanusia_phi.AAC.1